MIRRTTRLFVPLFALCIGGVGAASAAAQSITIVLLNGRTAKPIAHSSFNLWGDMQKAALPLTFDSDGRTRFVLKQATNEETQPTDPSNNNNLPSVRYADTLRIQLGYQPCWENNSKAPQFSRYMFSTQTILQEGLAEPNHCSSHTVTAKPGELILFVKPLTFWQSMRD